MCVLCAYFVEVEGRRSCYGEINPLQAEFGNAYGVLIPELRLLARTVFVVDRKGLIQYIQLVREIAEEPDYDAVLKSLDKPV